MAKTEQFLWQPVSPWRVHQGFGDNLACIKKDTKSGVIACDGHNPPKGYRSVYSSMNGHNGLDVYAVRWQPVYASHSGIVEEVQTEVARGLGVGVVSDDKRFFAETNSSEHYKTRYWHFISLDVNIGDQVKVGTLLGYADNTGYSAGDHLHYELKPVTQNSKGKWINILQTNGYFGAVDPTPYMAPMFAPHVNLFVRVLEELAKRLDALSDTLRRK